MIFKETLSLSASSAAATTYATPHLIGELRKIRMVKGTMSTSKTITIGIAGDSTTIAFAKYKMGTTGQNYFPTVKKQGATGATVSSSDAWGIVLCDEKIKVWVQATSSGDKRTGTINFWIDGIPGLGGTTTT